MPRTLSDELKECHERAAPATRRVVEVAAPDVGQVLRRAGDQWFTDAPTGPRVSESPAGSTAADESGALTLAAAAGAGELLASKTTPDSTFTDIRPQPADTRFKTLSWLVDPTFQPARLKTFEAKVSRSDALITSRLKLQIYRATRIPGRYGLANRPGQPAVDYHFTPILSPAPVLSRTQVNTLLAFGVGPAWVSFDLTPYALTVDNTPGKGPPGGTSEENEYYFELTALDIAQTADDRFRWEIADPGLAYVAGVGSFLKKWFTRNSSSDLWVPAPYNQTNLFRLYVENYAPAGGHATVVYVLDMGRAPAAGTTGRAVFLRRTPGNSLATMELSTAGTGGPWTAITDGTLLATAQQTYHLRVTLTPNGSGRAAPAVEAAGVEWRTVQDVSAEVVAVPLAQEVGVPWLAANIAEGSLRLLRVGQRDYEDRATTLGATAAPSTLEVDTYVGAPGVPWCDRTKWLHVERASVTQRDPEATAEVFSLLSYAKRCKRKIPAPVETISTVHTVITGTTALHVRVSPDLPGATATGHEYAGRGYYLRVRTSADPDLAPGFIATIDDNSQGSASGSNANQLDFTTALPSVFAVGDVVEVHSGVRAQPRLTWEDADPADVWWEILTDLLGIPPERIGHGGLGRAGRSGLPPRLADIAPGDAATQDALRVTFSTDEAEDGWNLLQQVSFIRGGSTVEVEGQIVFRQIVPLRDADGVVVVRLETSPVVFDVTNIVAGSLATPTGLEQRAPLVQCAYGRNYAAADPDSYSLKTAVWGDADAIAWHAQQDLEDLGFATVPDEIARWCYNSADGGFYLATQLCRQVALIASTGLRVWSWRSTEWHPELVVGDTVSVLTDRYTDWDPSRGLALKGLIAYPATILAPTDGGRTFRALIPGLSEATKLQGGSGTTAGPAQPHVTVTATASGTTPPGVDVSVQGTNGELGIYRLYRAIGADPAPVGVPLIETIADAAGISYHDDTAHGIAVGDVVHYLGTVTIQTKVGLLTSVIEAGARASATVPSAGSAPHVDDVALDGSALELIPGPGVTSAVLEVTPTYGGASAGDREVITLTLPGGSPVDASDVAATTGAGPFTTGPRTITLHNAGYGTLTVTVEIRTSLGVFRTSAFTNVSIHWRSLT